MLRRPFSFGSSQKLSGLGLALALTLVAPALQAAEQNGSYRVASGDTLSGIAARHKVTVAQLCAENGISRDRILRTGQLLKLPTKKAAGITASKSAKPSASPSDAAERRKVADATASKSAKPSASPRGAAERPGSLPRVSPPLAKRVPAPPPAQSSKPKGSPDVSAKSLGPSTPDAKLAARTATSCGTGSRSGSLAKCLPEKPLPTPKGQTATTTGAVTKPSWLAYSRRPAKPGYLHLQSTVGEWSGQAVVGNWHIPEGARAGIARALASWRSGAEERIHGRLIRLLVRVSDQFGGRPIRIVSGYRPHKESRYTPHSKHTLGRAVDFSIPGVPNDVLRDYLRAAFKDVGVGYYPNSTHVHLDIRDEDTYWVDYSSPGQAPSYGGPPRAKPATVAALASGANGKSSGATEVTPQSGTGSSVANPAPTSPEAAPGAGAGAATSAAPSQAAPSNAAPSNTASSNTAPSDTAPSNTSPSSPTPPLAHRSPPSPKDSAPVAPERGANSPPAHDTHTPESS